MYAKFFKRFLDFWLSLTAIIALSPLMLVLTLIGAIAMRGNPFFVQKRPGKIDPKTGKEKIFSMLKLRTMTNEKDANGKLLPDDIRLTGYGKFLRSTSLDELPQLINVLIGEMSLVGPRPLLIKYLDEYTPEQRRRHNVRPGITGESQIHGRNTLSWEERFKLDVEYADNVTFFKDVRIVFQTVGSVLKRTGISSGTCETMEEYKKRKRLD